MLKTITKLSTFIVGFILASLMTTDRAQAQNYSFAASSGTFTPIAGGTNIGSNVETWDNVISGALPIGFTFSYFGSNYTQFKASSNGIITFNVSTTNSYNTNDISSSGGLMVAPLWDDLQGGTGASASYLLSGSSPNRVLTVEWLKWAWKASASAPGISFQVKLYETSNKIEFVYKQESGSLYFPSASIGIIGGTAGEFYSLANTSTLPVLDLNGNNFIDTKPATGQIYSFTPSSAPVAPSIQASNINASSKTATTMSLSWTNGNGNYRAVFMKQTTSTSDAVSITNGKFYKSAAKFGDSNVISGWYCVYNGTGNAVNVTGLESGLAYQIHVLEYNGLGGSQKYLTTTGTNNPTNISALIVKPSTPVSTLSILNVNESAVTLSLIKGDGAGRAIFAKASASNLETAPVVDNTTYTPNSSFGSGTQVGTSGWYCVFNGGSLNTITVTGLTSNTPYTFHVVDYNGNPSSELYNIANVTDNPVKTTTFKNLSPTYTFATSTTTFTPISGATVIDGIKDDDEISSSIPIGFSFIFGGNSFTDIIASSNGFISFNPYLKNSGSSFPENNLVSSSAHPAIAALWDDLNGITGEASYITTGTAPNRIFTIEYLNWRWNYQANGSVISFQIKLYEDNNKIELIYRSESGAVNDPSASIGLAFPVSGAGHFMSLNNSTGSATVSSTSETANISTKPETGRVFSFTPAKSNQTISFASLSNKALGDPAFTIAATSDSNLPVTFSTTSDKITLTGSQVEILKAGSVTIKADQAGNGSYNAASQVTYTFCINPAKPIFTVDEAVFPGPVLTSSIASGNQWFKDGVAISGATNSTYTITEAGTYTLTASVDNCSSVPSDGKTLIVTGIEELTDSRVSLYPTPASDHVTVDVTSLQSATPVLLAIYNPAGKVLNLTMFNGKTTIPVESYTSGIYILKINSNKHVITKKLIKK